MADNAKVLYEYLSKEGLQAISKGILQHVNSRINERIVSTINVDSDEQHMPSAAAVYRAIRDSHHARIVAVTGDINSIPLEKRETDVLYYQRDDEEDTTWMLYIWDAEGQQFINVGTTEIDLSNYWQKTDTVAIREDLGIPAIELDIEELKSAVQTINSDIADINSAINGIGEEIGAINDDLDDIHDELDTKVAHDEIGPIPKAVVKSILDNAYAVTDPFKYQNVATMADIAGALEGEADEIDIRLTADINLTAEETKSIVVPAGKTLEVVLDEAKITCTDNAFKVSEGATLKLIGDGEILATTKAAKAAITAENGSTVIIDGITIDGTSQGTEDNWVYGVYAKNHSRVEFKSGIIKVAGASCISTNNTTGGSDIIVTGGELYADGGYAIYCPAQGTVDITNATVQGIHARMGTINIGAGAKIIPPTIDESNAAPLGSNINTSGSVELGDAIVLIAGSYSDANGIDIELNVTDDATVASNFRSAIGVYMFDTKAAANVEINVENGDNVVTADGDFDAIKVYDHDYINAAAVEAGKTYSPVATSTVTVNVD